MTQNPRQPGPFEVGDRLLDKYEVRGLLGKGGHAFVYDCFNAFLAEEVAIKVIPNPPHRGKQHFNRARGEAQLLYRLNHPNVVKVMDGGELDGMAYIVMEKLEGMTLRELLRQFKRLTVVEALSIALQIADALESAHAMNVIHRDLKPDNIFLLAGNHVKVLDFGIAKFLEGGYQTTQKDLIHGTAPYMSPEQAQGHGVTFASDIFQLGIILYEMIAGICPCMIGVEEPTLQVLVAIQISKLPPRLKTMARGVPEYVDLLVWRAIAKAAQQRYPVMRDFTDAIQAALERLKAELEPRELMMRVVPSRAKSAAASPKPPRPQLLVAQTTPTALVTSRSFQAAAASFGASDAARASFRPESVAANRASQLERPSNTDLRRSSPAATPRRTPASADQLPEKSTRRGVSANPAPVLGGAANRSGIGAPRRSLGPPPARRVLLRAALVGAALALPGGVFVGLAKRRHELSTRSPLAAAPVAQASPAPDPARAPTASASAAASPGIVPPSSLAANPAASPLALQPALPSNAIIVQSRVTSRTLSHKPAANLSATSRSGLASNRIGSGLPTAPEQIGNSSQSVDSNPAAASDSDHKPNHGKLIF